MSAPIAPPLHLLHRVAQIHDTRDSGRDVQVIPVLVDSDTAVPKLAKTMAERNNGLFINTDTAFARPRLGPLAEPVAPIRSAIERSLTISNWHLQRTPTFQTSDGATTVHFAENNGGPGSEADQRLLRVATALMDPELATVPLAVVSLSEAGLGDAFRDALWDLIGQLEGVRVGVLRTLVFLVEVDPGIDVHPHCQHLTGFRLALTSGTVSERHPSSRLSGAVRMFNNGAQTRPLVLFLGAGFSASSGMRMGDWLRDESLKFQIGEGVEAMTALQRAAAFRALEGSALTTEEEQMTDEAFLRSLTFERVMRSERMHFDSMPTMQLLGDQDQAALLTPGPAVSALHRMLENPRKLVIATVNLDRLIETGAENKVRVFASDEEFSEAPDYIDSYFAGDERQAPVLKLHGSIERPDTYVIADTQTGYGLSAEKIATLHKLAGSEADRKTWIYTGASMRDIDLNAEFWAGTMSKGTTEYWVAPHITPTVSEFADHRRDQWANDTKRGRTLLDRTVTETADVFLSALSKTWNCARGRS